jgi:flagellar biosynthesis protein FlhG
MPDQATDLRALVRQVAMAHAPVATRPRRIVVLGAKEGVGTTTIAVNLAAALAQQAQRSLLCDAAGGDVAIQCRLDVRHTLVDALGGKRTLAEILCPGPGGVQILPGAQEFVRWHETAEYAWNRLMAQLAALIPRPESVVIDVGSQADWLTRQLWQSADRALVVTTVDTAAIMSAYASIKLLTDLSRPVSVALVVNRAPQESMADEAQQRLAQACRRFLGLPLRTIGNLPEDASVQRCAARGECFVLAAPGSPAGLRLRQLCRALGNHAPVRQPAAA